MTDSPPSPTDPNDDDLLASLYLDGEATAQERAQIESSPALMARVRAFAAIADELQAIAPPPELRSRQISAALELFDQQHSPALQDSPAQERPAQERPATVTSLGRRREAKTSKGLPTWLGVAAAAALVVGGLGFASTLLGGDTDDAAMDAASEPAASSTNRDAMSTSTDEAFAAESADALDADDTAEAPMAEEAMEEGAMEDEATDEAADDVADDSGDGAGGEEFETSLAPIPLDGLDATTAAEYLELLGDLPLLPLSDSPCAESPTVQGLIGVDSYLPVVFSNDLSSLLVQAGSPNTAVIVGPTCEIELE